ncbi:MAG: ATP-binding cassette domain-containing protein, partial [Eubacteriales bacterium]|nr:ATP-binding cassette domain-containing protein [Eubacteriales bacterium]
PEDLRKRIAYVFQTPYLFGDTVMENMEFPYIVRNMKPDHERIKELFSTFKIPADYLERDTYRLSGGEKQRISLIRSLLFTPDILLLDEITSALDLENAAIVEKVICSLNCEGKTILWITHNPEQSKKYANKILNIESGAIKSFEEVLTNEWNK